MKKTIASILLTVAALGGVATVAAAPAHAGIDLYRAR